MSESIESTAPGQRGAAPLGLLGLAVFSALAISPALLAVFLGPGSLQSALESVAFSVVLWAFWLAAWGAPLRGCAAATPLLLVTPAAILLLLQFRSPINVGVLGIALETNLEETRAFLRGQWPAIGAAYGATAVLAGSSLWLMARHEVRWPRRWRYVALLALPVVLGALHLAYSPLESAAAWMQPAEDPLRTTIWPLEVESLRPTAPFGVVLQAIDGIESERLVGAVSRAMAGFRFGARQAPVPAERQVYVLVIGESSRADRWSINGYTKPTAPRLAGESNLVSFRDVVTPVPATRVAVPLILTRKTAMHALDNHFAERSLVSAFREAGFATYWLSTQSPLGTFDASYAMYAKEADHTTYFNLTGGWNQTPVDGVMLEPLRRILAAPDEARQLIVLHTLGSHLEYRARYPKEFGRFQPALELDDPGLIHDAEYKARLNNAYDNSVLYADYVVSEIVNAVRESGRALGLVLYVSDHGEDLYDGGCDNWAHGKPTVANVRVPMFMWYSAAYATAFPDKVASMREHATAPLTAESVFPSLLDAADIRFPGEDLRRSVLSPSFAPPTKRLVLVGRAMVDFDRAHIGPQCLLVP
jgi:glucan phosphoethanolaminetransferase (alkaline phosphatase superfamily)